VPAGRLTLLDALPGTGKTTLVASLLGAITRDAGQWPDGTPVEKPVTAVLIAHEDDPGTIRARIEAAGGDASRVHLWLKNAAGHLPRIPQDLEELRGLLKTTGAKLLVLDPIAGAIDTAGGDSKTRDRLAELLSICADLGVAVLGLRHPTKQGASSRGPALYRAGGGSVAIPALARAAYLLAGDPADPKRLVLAPTKASLSRLPGSLALRIVEGANGAPAMEWLGASPLDADQLLNAAAEGGALTDAIKWLTGLLRGGEAMAVSNIRAMGADDGFAWRTLERAKKAAGVVSRQERRGWVWLLPRVKGANS
jgi:putative DNA primase/helicase